MIPGGAVPTATLAPEHALAGFYWSEQSRRWVDDKIVMLFVDFPGGWDDPAIAGQAKTIKAEIERFYKEENSPQEELWCTAEQIMLIV